MQAPVTVPKVSVVIPTCDRVPFLRAAIHSVLNQTFQDFEIIVVDDASCGETEEMVRSLPDQRIRYLRHATKQGQGPTRNAGIRLAVGEYVALLDDDDEWLPQKLERQVRLMDDASPRVGMVYTGYYRIEGSTKRVLEAVVPEKRGNLFDALCSKNWVGTCSTVLVRRACFARVGLFDEELASGADYDMWLRIAKEFEVECISEPLAYYAVHGNQLSTDHRVKIQGIEAQFRKHEAFFAADSKNHGRRYLALGLHYCYAGDVKHGREAFRKAIKLYPFELRHYFNWCLSFIGAENFKKLKHLRGNSGAAKRQL